MGDCKSCGSCGSCGGCASHLELTAEELNMLEKLGSIPFLPVARRRDDMTPVYLEDQDYTPQQYSIILQHLEAKHLISLDYDKPLSGCDMSAYGAYPVHGSMALTQRGQAVLDLLDRQGIT